MKKSLGCVLFVVAAASGIAAAASDLADGEVRKVDLQAQKVTIKHGEIKHLEMPAMTMVFQVKDAALLARLKAGDRIRFRASHEAGTYTVTRIEMVR